MVIQCTYDVMLAGWRGCGCGGDWRHTSLPGDVIGKSNMGEVTSVATGALGGADGSVLICWKKTPCPAAAAGGGMWRGNDMVLLLTVAGATDTGTDGAAGGGA